VAAAFDGAAATYRTVRANAYRATRPRSIADHAASRAGAVLRSSTGAPLAPMPIEGQHRTAMNGGSAGIREHLRTPQQSVSIGRPLVR
jgi:hypothetical protein